MQPISYQDYFRFRGVSPTDYLNAPLPPWLEKVIPKERDTAVLDIGCGFGQMLLALKRAGYTNLSGIDLEDSAIDYCRKEGLDVRKTSILEYSPEAPRYDVAIMSHVLEHIPKKETISVLTSIRTRILKPNGMLLVMVPNAQAHTGCYWMYEDWTHETLFTAGSLLYVLRVAGFPEISLCDPQAIEGNSLKRRIVRRLLLPLYDGQLRFWNWVTASAFHAASPRIYTFELKALARVYRTTP